MFIVLIFSCLGCHCSSACVMLWNNSEQACHTVPEITVELEMYLI